MEAFAGERIEETGGVADEEPAASGPPRHPVAERPGAGDRVGRFAVAPDRRVTVDRGDRGDDRIRDRARPVADERRPPRPAEHDADVDPTARDRRDPDVAVTQDAHPGVAARGRVGVGEVVGEPDAWVEPGRSRDAGRPSHDRMRTIGPDDDPCRERRRLGRPAAAARGVPAPRSTPGHVPAAPDVGARGDREIEQRRIEPRPVEPDRRARRRRRRRRSAGRSCRPRSRPASPGIGRATVPPGSCHRDRLRPKCRDRRGRGEDAAGPPVPRRRPLEDDDLVAGRREPRRQDGARRPAADDRDLDPPSAAVAADPAAHSPAPWGSGRPSGAPIPPAAGAAAIA